MAQNNRLPKTFRFLFLSLPSFFLSFLPFLFHFSLLLFLGYVAIHKATFILKAQIYTTNMLVCFCRVWFNQTLQTPFWSLQVKGFRIPLWQTNNKIETNVKRMRQSWLAPRRSHESDGNPISVSKSPTSTKRTPFGTTGPAGGRYKPWWFWQGLRILKTLKGLQRLFKGCWSFKSFVRSNTFKCFYFKGSF